MRGWLALGFGLLLLVSDSPPLSAQDNPDSERLTGRLLVAAPHMTDPNFAHTVVYMLDHDWRGAIGLVINRPMGEVPLNRVLELMHDGESAEAGPDGGGAGGAVAPLQVFFGGPVEPYRAFTLHSRDVMPEHSVPVDEDTAYSERDDVLMALADDAAPESLLFALGYAGWAPGQLEGELKRGDWYVVTADPSLVFSTDPERIWERAVALHSTAL